MFENPCITPYVVADSLVMDFVARVTHALRVIRDTRDYDFIAAVSVAKHLSA